MNIEYLKGLDGTYSKNRGQGYPQTYQLNLSKIEGNRGEGGVWKLALKIFARKSGAFV